MSNNVTILESLMTPPSSPLICKRNVAASGFNPTTTSTMPKAEINTAAWVTTPTTAKASITNVTFEKANNPTSFVFGATPLFKPEPNTPAFPLPKPFTTFHDSDTSFHHLRGQLDIVQAQFDTVRDELELAKTEVKSLKGHFEAVRAEVEGVKTEVKAATESIASLQQLFEFIQTKALQYEVEIENLKGIVKILQTQHMEREARVQLLEQAVAAKGLTFVQTLGLIFGALDNLDNGLSQLFWPQGKLAIEDSGKVYGEQLFTIPKDDIEFTRHSHDHIALHDDELGGETDVEDGEIQFANVHRGDEVAHGHEQDHLVEESEHTVSANAIGIRQLGRGSPANGGSYGGWCSVM